MASPRPGDLVAKAVELARQAGADQVDAIAHASTESSVTVRLGQREKLIQNGSGTLGLRVINGGRTAVCSTSDFTDASFAQFVKDTVELANIAAPDEHAGLPDPADLASNTGGNGLGLFDEQVAAITTEQQLEMALACESAAMDHDARISNSDGATMTAVSSEIALANSLGFHATYPATSSMLMVEVMADDADGKKRNAHWFSFERALHKLDDPADVGRKAAQRAVDQVGARKVETKQVPVVFEPRTSTYLLRDLAGCTTGAALYRGSTFLKGKEGETIASPLVTVTDDPSLPGRGGSRPFDDEGVGVATRQLVEGGVFTGFLFDSYSARRTGQHTTGSAHRSAGSLPDPGPSNLVLQPGATSVEELLAPIDQGLFVTDLLGFGFNPTTGDYSRGAAGFWIENGRIAYPVTEVNISGNLKTMLTDIDAVADDLTWFASSAAPTVRIKQMTVSGT